MIKPSGNVLTDLIAHIKDMQRQLEKHRKKYPDAVDYDIKLLQRILDIKKDIDNYYGKRNNSN